MKILASQRKSDSFGSGHYGASRGSRKHSGVDYACYPKSKIFSPVTGQVTKLGYPYADDTSFRYVQVTTREGYDVRVFYVNPSVNLNDQVNENSIIGSSQELGKRYPEITEHVHLEIKGKNGKFVNPMELNL